MPETLKLQSRFATAWQGGDPFLQVDRLQGEVYRQAPGRRTLRFEFGSQTYFAKIHHGVGWQEIFKNLFTLRRPILSARTEWQAIKRLGDIGIPTMTIAAYGERGLNPARRHSFLITEALAPTISLETLCANWPEQRPSFVFKRQLINELARIAAGMHQHGVCHRDFYLCHILLSCVPDGSVDQTARPSLSVIDLHRAIISDRLAQRWIIKDIAGLLFSSADIGLTRTDLYRFVRAYTGLSLRVALRQQTTFWQRVADKADRIALRDRQKALRPMLRDLYTSSPARVRQQRFDRVAVFDRADDGPQLQAFIGQPDTFMVNARMLKNGDSTTVVALKLDGKLCVVKRYNLRNFWYVLRRLFRPSRAWHCWRNAHMLEAVGVDTPRPVLLLEQRWGPLRRVAYFVTEWSEGEDVLTLLADRSAREVPWPEILLRFRQLFTVMRRYQLIHGDMKVSNFLYLAASESDGAPGRLTVLDLDATRQEGCRKRFRKYFAKDVNRFLANWRDDASGLMRVRKCLGDSVLFHKSEHKVPHKAD